MNQSNTYNQSQNDTIILQMPLLDTQTKIKPKVSVYRLMVDDLYKACQNFKESNYLKTINICDEVLEKLIMQPRITELDFKRNDILKMTATKIKEYAISYIKSQPVKPTQEHNAA